MGKRRVKKRFYVFIFLLLALLATVLFMVMGKDAENVIEQGAIIYEQTADVVLLRDEKVVQADNYAKIVFNALEGEHVNTGTKIMEIYKWGYTDAPLNDLMAKQQEIMKYQQEMQQDTINKALDQMNEDIQAKMNAISELVQNKTKGDLLAMERDLAEAMEQRRILLKEALQPDQMLTQLYADEQRMIDRIEMYKQDVIADAPGVVSFYFDGNETMLTPARIKSLTQEEIVSVIRGTASKTSESRVEKPIYRMVNNQRWFCLLPSGKEDNTLLAGKGPYDIVFAGYYDTPYSGTLEAINNSEGGRLYVFEMSGDVGPLIGVRRIQATIKCKFEGLRVPLRALTKEEDEEGILLHSGGEKVFVPVTVTVRDGQHAIISPKNANTIIQPGQLFAKP